MFVFIFSKSKKKGKPSPSGQTHLLQKKESTKIDNTTQHRADTPHTKAVLRF